MKITLKDGSVKEYSEAMTVNDIAFDIAGGLGRAACAGEVDGEVVDLRTTIDKDCTLNILQEVYRKKSAYKAHTQLVTNNSINSYRHIHHLSKYMLIYLYTVTYKLPYMSF